ncbi:hypothetical protein BKA62DRAFT_676926 [Auriculariales sp. MPI-PUGE-AT-0066]|nr:hypothetical protein BKA62DRAFT_676926 [Auriculariales sp. MPI-PUGE-AT-0066]
MRLSRAAALLALFSPLVSPPLAQSGTKSSSSSAPSWISSLPSRGNSPLAPNAATYKVRKSVKDYGAKGDGKTDDTAAINAAVYDQGSASALTPLLLCFPPVSHATSIYNVRIGMSRATKHRSRRNLDGEWERSFLGDIIINGGAVGLDMGNQQQGAVGDGVTDDTAALQRVLDRYAGCKVIFVDAGVYKVTKTLEIPAGTQMTGEAWSTIMGAGSYFGDAAKPKVVVRVGAQGSTGIVEISDILFQTAGPAPGAIVVEWNVHDPSGEERRRGHCGTASSGSASWRSARRARTTPLCRREFTMAGGLWVWTADHDLELGTQSNIFTARGIYSESRGPVWLVGSGSEHSVMYQYNLVGAANHWLGIIQLRAVVVVVVETFLSKTIDVSRSDRNALLPAETTRSRAVHKVKRLKRPNHVPRERQLVVRAHAQLQEHPDLRRGHVLVLQELRPGLRVDGQLSDADHRHRHQLDGRLDLWSLDVGVQNNAQLAEQEWPAEYGDEVDELIPGVAVLGAAMRLCTDRTFAFEDTLETRGMGEA